MARVPFTFRSLQDDADVGCPDVGADGALLSPNDMSHSSLPAIMQRVQDYFSVTIIYASLQFCVDLHATG